jgi:alanine racemase
MLTKLLVNETQIKKNCLFLKKELKDKQKFPFLTATVKGNGYGHDAVSVGKIAIENGIDTLAVARVSEAIQLRENLKSKYEIMLIGIIDEEDIPLAKKYNFSFPVSSLEQVKKVIKYDLKKVKIQYKLNTGMNRIGFKNPDELLEAYKLLQKKGVINFGIYSHIYDNDNIEKTIKQFDLFEKLMKIIPDWKKIPYRHIRASESVDKLIRGIIPKRE